MKITITPIEDVKPYEGNPREIPQAAIEAVRKSIEQYDMLQPVVVDGDGVVVVGHTRLAAMKAMGWRTIPVHVADLSEEEARAYRIADNRTNELSTWDEELLALELEAIVGMKNGDVDELARMTLVDSAIIADLIEYRPEPSSALAGGYEPVIGTTSVSDVNLVARQARLEGKHEDFQQERDARKVEVQCPDCEHRFRVAAHYTRTRGAVKSEAMDGGAK